MTTTLRTAAPRAGRSLEGLVAPMREHVLAAAMAAEAVISSPLDWLRSGSRRDLIEGDALSRSAWAMVSLLLVDMVRTKLPPSYARAVEWFGASAEGDWSQVERALGSLAQTSGLASLLPYLLDTYGRTTRLDVLRDSSLSGSRAQRKQAGSFYTPQDVADFMVEAVAGESCSQDAEAEWWLDPAIGSGVFLAAALRRHSQAGRSDDVDFATTRLTGCDISPQACDFASFVILGGVADKVDRPLDAWTAIRHNIVALDATRPDRERGGLGLRELLNPGNGPLRLICNPPYATSGATSVSMADGRPTTTVYLPFVEMAWRVASSEDDSACLVVPLALGANRSSDFRRCRIGMTASGGDWTLLFFDRQPHALFGEEAKTRATIVIRRNGRKAPSFRTSRLLKWTSRQRSSIFNEARAVDMGEVSIGRMVPKLGSVAEVNLYRLLDSHRLPAGARAEPSKALASEIVGNALSSDVFVAGTAYNFLNVFRNYPDHLSWRGTLSTSGIHRLRCSAMDDADIVTAILTSRFAFWLWHVECDGFHVPAWFLSELPLLNLKLSSEMAAELGRLGRLIWDGLQQDVICSSNRERLTFAFRPTSIGELRQQVDELLAEALGAERATGLMLREFEEQVVSIDGSIRLSKTRTVKE